MIKYNSNNELCKKLEVNFKNTTVLVRSASSNSFLCRIFRLFMAFSYGARNSFFNELYLMIGSASYDVFAPIIQHKLSFSTMINSNHVIFNVTSVQFTKKLYNKCFFYVTFSSFTPNHMSYVGFSNK